jgi:hypothetical protein
MLKKKKYVRQELNLTCRGKMVVESSNWEPSNATAALSFLAVSQATITPAG